VGGIGVTYYFNPQAPSPFLIGGLGFSSWAAPFEENAETWYGFGLVAGGGYEFSRHLSIEGSLSWGNPTKEELGIEASTNALSLKATINVLGY